MRAHRRRRRHLHLHASPTSPAPLEFKPLLDDATWSRGPNYTVAPGATVDVYPHFTTVAGSVDQADRRRSTRPTLGNDRAVWAYLPPSYDENTRARFPVLYMHDGQNLFDPALAFGGNEWKVDETLDAAAEDGSIAEIIVIGVENTAARIYEYTPTTDPAHARRRRRRQVPRARSSASSSRRSTACCARCPIARTPASSARRWAGSSAPTPASSAPDVFGIVGAMSPSTWWNDAVIIGDVGGMPTRRAPVARLRRQRRRRHVERRRHRDQHARRPPT